jgi:hypothetical protein
LPFIKKLHNISDKDSTNVKNLYYVITKYIKNGNEDKNSVVLVCIDKESMQNTIETIKKSSIYIQLLKKNDEVLQNNINVKNKGSDIKRKQEFLSFINTLNPNDTKKSNVTLNGGDRYDEYGSPDKKPNNTHNPLANSYYGYDNTTTSKQESKINRHTEKSHLQKLKDKIDNCFNYSFDNEDKIELEKLIQNANAENKVETNTLINTIKDKLPFLIQSDIENITQIENTTENTNESISNIKTQIADLKKEYSLLQNEFDKFDKFKNVKKFEEFEKSEKDNILNMLFIPSITKIINVDMLKQYIRLSEIHNNNDNIKYIYAVGNEILYKNQNYIISSITNSSLFNSDKKYSIILDVDTRYPSFTFITRNNFDYISQLSDANAKKILDNIGTNVKN